MVPDKVTRLRPCPSTIAIDHADWAAGRCLRVAPHTPNLPRREAVARLRFTAALGLLFGVALFDAAEEGRTCCTRLTRRFWCIATFAPNDLRHYEGSR